MTTSRRTSVRARHGAAGPSGAPALAMLAALAVLAIPQRAACVRWGGW